MTFETSLLLAGFLVVLVAANKRVVSVEHKGEQLEDLLEDDLLLLANRNMSHKPRKLLDRYPTFEVTMAPPMVRTPHPLYLDALLFQEEDLLPTEIFEGELLSRDKRQAGSGDDSSANATFTSGEQFAMTSSNTQTRLSRMASAAAQLTTLCVGYGVGIDTITVISITNENGNALYSLVVTFTLSTDRRGLAYALARIFRDETEIVSFSMIRNPQQDNAADVLLNAICLLCPATRPCTSAGFCALFSIVASPSLFEYGLSEADIKLPNRDDVTGRRITVPGDGFPLGNSYETNIYVGENGIVSFARAFNPYDLTSMRTVTNQKFVCIYCNDWDNRNPGGDVWYQAYPAGKAYANNMLDRASAEIQANTRYNRFKASFVFVATWSKVPQFLGYTRILTQGSTFQMVLITDGKLSFVRFRFHDIQASAFFRGGGVHGYRTGPGFSEFHEMLYSRRGRASLFRKPLMHTVIGNTGETGVWLFKIGEIITPNYPLQCINWYLQNVNQRFYFRRRAAILRSNRCPCRRNILFMMARFLPAPPFRNQAVYCAEMQGSFGVDTFECCYDFFGRFISRFPDAGSYIRYSSRFDPIRHQLQDSDPKDWCCRRSNLCHLYESVRPRSRCFRRRPRFIFIWNFGEPHFTTLDRKTFTFNGIGEYRLVELEPADKQFKFRVQCRTAQAVDSNGQKIQASLFSAFAAEQTSSNSSYGSGKVHVQLNSNRDKLVIYFDDIDTTEEFYNDTTFEKILPQLTATKQSETRIDFAFTQIEVVFAVQIVSGTLSQALIIPDQYKGLPIGLLGNFNDNPDDDFRYPNGSLLPGTSTDRDLFPLGQAWAVPDQASSILHYAPDETLSSFSDTSFVPLFTEQITDAVRNAAVVKCGNGNEQCIYDYALTNNEALAKEAITQLDEANRNTDLLENRAPELIGTSKIDLEINQQSDFRFIASDEDGDNVTYVVVEAPTAFSLNETSGIATYTPTSTNPLKIRVAARDTKDAQSSVFDVQVRLCPGCGANGRCDFSVPTTPVTSEDASLFQSVSCVCNTGYTGATCNENKDGCEGDPCGTGRTCTDSSPADEVATNKSFTCSDCLAGYVLSNESSVEKCENIDECASSDACSANATCVDTLGSYLCNCDVGFRKNSAGKCVDIDECVEHLYQCIQTCTNTVGSYSCDCYTGFVLDADGITCTAGTLPAGCPAGCTDLCTEDGAGNLTCKCREGYELDNTDNKTCKNINECDRHLCAQVCTDTDGSYTCSCLPGFQLAQDNLDCEMCEFPNWGDRCNNTCECMGRASECSSVHGCVCLPGWTGINCRNNVDECTINPKICGESQKCTDTEGSYNCTCESGYVANGTDCVDVNECDVISDNIVCPSNSVCKNLVGSFVCNCNLGFKKESSNCVDIDECATGQAMCQHSCRNKIGSYNCYCSRGYTLTDDRKTCSKDPTTTSPCDGLTNMQCAHYCALENDVPKCQCNRAYYLAADNITCLDVNECDDNTLNQCTDKSTCVNTNGSYTCSCPTGQRIQNDGRTCVVCDDAHWGDGCANECNCSPLGTDQCDKVQGCKCNTGWTGANCGDDVDECSTAVCQANSDCVNLPGTYKCTCRTGYRESADKTTCNELNECLNTADNECDHSCTDTVGSYYCTCQPGFILEGKGTCVDIDECTKGTQDCQHLCRNTIGSFTCECYDGYQLDSVGRKTCSPTAGTTTCAISGCDSANGGCSVNTCFCNGGYQLNADGKNCSDIDECSPTNSCSGGCSNTPAGSFTCTCTAGFQLAGDKTTCEACPPGKYGDNCANNCTCDSSNSIACNVTDGSCSCRTGWMGGNCTDDIKECTDTPNICGNNGVCNEKDGTYTCTCEAGFIRSNNACAPCTSTTWGIACNKTCDCEFANTVSCNAVTGQCSCKSGWSGDTCITNVDECSNTASPVCTGANQQCRDTTGSFACDCTTGYEKNADNTACVDTNECLNSTANTCTFQCDNTVGSFSCSCPAGYTGTENACTVNFVSYFITIVLDFDRSATIDNPTSAAYRKLQEDIGRGIDLVILLVHGAYLPTNVKDLSKGSVVAPSEIRIDNSKTSNPDGVLAAALEKLAEDRSISVDASATAISNVTYKNIPITKAHTVCEVLQIIRNFTNDEYCEVGTDGIPVVRQYTDTGLNIPLIVGLSVAVFILLLLLLICIIYVCCFRRRRSSERTPSEERDVAFRSAFVGNLPIKGNFGASRYMMYSPHTLSDAGSVTSDNSSGRHPRRGGRKNGAFSHDMPYWERGQALPHTSRADEPRVNDPSSNFSWEHLFDRLEPMRGRQFEMPRPTVNSSPSRPFRDSLA